jgi:hypothetical protein
MSENDFECFAKHGCEHACDSVSKFGFGSTSMSRKLFRTQLHSTRFAPRITLVKSGHFGSRGSTKNG